jgi:two-component system OmpR family sensor kinase
MTTTDERRGPDAEATVPRESSGSSRSPAAPVVGPMRRRRTARLLGDARTHVLTWFVAVVAIAVVGSVLIGRQVLLARLDARIDGELRQEVEELRRLATGDDPETGEPFAGDVERIFDLYVVRNVPYPHERVFFYTDGVAYRPEQLPDGYQPPAGVEQQWAAVTRTQPGRFTSGVGDVDYLAVPLEQTAQTRGVFVVAIYGDVERDEIAQVVETMGLVGVVAILVAAGLAWFGAGRILAPIRRLTQTAASISDRDLVQRIEVDGDDDVARLARTFNAMLDRLEHAFATQRRFLNDVGHELRTPITIVRGHLEVLGDDPDERRETVALVVDELERMRRLVDDLVVLAKAEQPDFLNLAPIDVGDLAREIVRKAERLADREWRLEACDDAVIVADRQRLTQATVQLAQNAVQHTGDGDTIALGASLVDDEARFWVRDSGPGFGGAGPRRLFERFVGERTGGSGLGLSIVKAIAQAHGGDVMAREAPGGGALFTITVPRWPRTVEPEDA